MSQEICRAPTQSPWSSTLLSDVHVQVMEGYNILKGDSEASHIQQVRTSSLLCKPAMRVKEAYLGTWKQNLKEPQAFKIRQACACYMWL